jgi:hypothetical protein
MRKAASIGIGMGTVAVMAVSAGAAMASTAAPRQQAGQVAVVSAASHHITRARAAAIAKAKVPHSRVTEIQSEDRHGRAVWEVHLATRHGRVIVDVDKKTGKATIVHRHKHGDGRDGRGRDDRGRDDRGRDDHGREGHGR